MNTKVYMVTGVTSRIGKAIAMELAKTGETVIMVAHDNDRGAQLEQEISAATQNPNLDLQLCDFSNMSSVRNLGTIVLSRYDQIHALINNTSVYQTRRETTLDGFEKMFATNYIGPFLLTYLLRDRLVDAGSARVINLTSPSMVELDFDDLQNKNRFNSARAFSATQTANLLFTFELARRMQDTGVTVNAVHPGLTRSSFALIRFLSRLLLPSPSITAQEIVQVATAPEFENINGKFLYKGKEIEPASHVLDPAIQQRLWEVTEELTNAPEQGPNYDPTGSREMYDEHKQPPSLIQT